ncbi:helicase HerA domain-containing protein [Microbulbifer sp. JMSA004]|uniref:helicase HerA domain-containing protein n=1 Tax=Microbulbifer sp. JMSA004 TaxID=3243370 RepID=UPI004039B28C
MASNVVLEELDAIISESVAQGVEEPLGPVGKIANCYVPEREASDGQLGDQLLGFLLNITYDHATIVTCDPWKRQCGGVPKNSLVLVKVSPSAVDASDRKAAERVVMVRITDSVPTPVAQDIIQTVYQIHKNQANIDPITQKELQWSALKGSVIGTFYDDDYGKITFGLDVDSYFSAHCYEVYVPTKPHLDQLINCFSEHPAPLTIGHLRYTETPSFANQSLVPVRVDPTDFVGKSYGHRTGLFGKTRFGKSNTMKVVADTVLSQENLVGQIVFDPSGEYTYENEQDDGSLYSKHSEKCVRYSLHPKIIAAEEEKGFTTPKELKINFFKNPDVGFGIISQMWAAAYNHVPDYISPTLSWEPKPLATCPGKTADPSGYNHYWRTMSLWFAILFDAHYVPKNADEKVYIGLKAPVRKYLAELAEIHENPAVDIDHSGDKPCLNDRQRIKALPLIFKKMMDIWEEHKGKKTWFGTSDGSSYFNKTEESMLKILSGQVGSGTTKFTRFKIYHSPAGGSVFQEIVSLAMQGKTVLVDLAMGDVDVRKAMARMICQELLSRMMGRFSQNKLGDTFVVLYFEEAHNLFPKDDRGLGDNVYNKIAKEGAKFNISMVYATQSMSTLSPDLLKNTENFIVTHLDDDREVRELEHKRAFRDVASDVERIQSKGYVRIKTLSMPMALPVQIRRFDGAADPVTIEEGE